MEGFVLEPLRVRCNDVACYDVTSTFKVGQFLTTSLIAFAGGKLGADSIPDVKRSLH